MKQVFSIQRCALFSSNREYMELTAADIRRQGHILHSCARRRSQGYLGQEYIDPGRLLTRWSITIRQGGNDLVTKRCCTVRPVCKAKRKGLGRSIGKVDRHGTAGRAISS